MIALALSVPLPGFRVGLDLGLDFAHALPKPPLVAQATGSGEQSEPPKAQEEVAHDSPRASMADFLDRFQSALEMSAGTR